MTTADGRLQTASFNRRRSRRRLTLTAAHLLGLSLIAAAPAEAIESNRSTYAYGEVSDSPDGTLLEVGERSGGVSYTYALDPDQRYRVALEGRRLAGRTTLRVGDSSGRLTYEPSPEQKLVFTVSDVDSLEILLYSDAPSRYSIKALEVSECDDCKTDTDLREEIVRALPSVESLAGSDPYTAAKQLLRWTSSKVAFSTDSGLPGPTSRASTADFYYQVLEPVGGGVACGGAAAFFRGVLHLFGIDAFVADFGDPQAGLTHVAVVLPLSEGGQRRYYYLDPTFDLLFESSDGSPQDLFASLDLLAARRPEDIRASIGDLRARAISDPEFVSSCGASPFGTWSACSLDEYALINSPSLLAGGYRTDHTMLLQLLATDLSSMYPYPPQPAAVEFADRLERFRSRYYAVDIDDATVLEGNGEAMHASFTVSVPPGHTQAVRARWSTADASAWAPRDYEASAGVVELPAGTTNATVTIPVRGNLELDGDRMFNLDLSDVTGAAVGRVHARGSILDDERPEPQAGVTQPEEPEAGVTQPAGPEPGEEPQGPLAPEIRAQTPGPQPSPLVKYSRKSAISTRGGLVTWSLDPSIEQLRGTVSFDAILPKRAVRRTQSRGTRTLRLGAARFISRPGYPARIRLRLSRSHLRLLVSSKRLTVRAVATLRDESGAVSRVSAALRLEAPHRSGQRVP